jgi:hypothetical protein
MAHFYIKNQGIYFKSEENSDERFLSGLTDRIHQDAKEAIEAWQNEFDDQDLDYANTDWLDEAFQVKPLEDDNKEVEAFESDIPKELFIQLFEKEVNVIR